MNALIEYILDLFTNSDAAQAFVYGPRAGHDRQRPGQREPRRVRDRRRPMRCLVSNSVRATRSAVCSRLLADQYGYAPRLWATPRATTRAMTTAMGGTTRATEAMRPILLLRWRKTAPRLVADGQARLTAGLGADGGLSTADSRGYGWRARLGGIRARCTGDVRDPVWIRSGPGWENTRPGWGDHRSWLGRPSARLGTVIGRVGVTSAPVVVSDRRGSAARVGVDPGRASSLRRRSVGRRLWLRRRFRRRGRPGRRGQRRIWSWGWPSRVCGLGRQDRFRSWWSRRSWRGVAKLRACAVKPVLVVAPALTTVRACVVRAVSVPASVQVQAQSWRRPGRKRCPSRSRCSKPAA